MNIEIPADDDGYSLLQCPLCGEYFKLAPNDYIDDGVLELYCPNCGLVSDNYLTEDVIKLAMTMAKNYAMDLIYEKMKVWERQFKGGNITFKAGKKPRDEYESPIQATIEAMIVHRYQCCGLSIKIKPLLKMTGSYCPYCGVKEFDTE